MVLQALRTSTIAFLLVIRGFASECITTTELDFTEKEACYFNDLTKKIINMNMNNLKLIAGTSSESLLEKQKYSLTKESSIEVISKIDKAEALLMEENSLLSSQIVDFMLLDSELRKLISQTIKLINENQIYTNYYLLRLEEKEQ